MGWVFFKCQIETSEEHLGDDPSNSLLLLICEPRGEEFIMLEEVQVQMGGLGLQDFVLLRPMLMANIYKYKTCIHTYNCKFSIPPGYK